MNKEAMLETVTRMEKEARVALEQLNNKFEGWCEFAIVDRKAKLPDIPKFQYDDPEIIFYLTRGAINYSKLLSGYVKEVK